MPHKLLITMKLRQPQQYKRFLSEDESVSGGTTIFAFKIKNIGDKLLPKGSVSFLLERPAGVGAYTKSTEDLEMSPLKPNETHTMDVRSTLGIPGLWVLTAKVKPADKEQVEYYESENAKLETEQWLKVLYVVDRHQLDVKSLLEKLLEKV